MRVTVSVGAAPVIARCVAAGSAAVVPSARRGRRSTGSATRRPKARATGWGTATGLGRATGSARARVTGTDSASEARRGHVHVDGLRMFPARSLAVAVAVYVPAARVRVRDAEPVRGPAVAELPRDRAVEPGDRVARRRREVERLVRGLRRARGQSRRRPVERQRRAQRVGVVDERRCCRSAPSSVALRLSGVAESPTETHTWMRPSATELMSSVQPNEFSCQPSAADRVAVLQRRVAVGEVGPVAVGGRRSPSRP